MLKDLVHKNGFWNVTDSEHHTYDDRLAEAICRISKMKGVKTALDFGCGMGQYIAALHKHRIKAIGYDGNINTYELSKGLASTLDLSQPINLKRTYDLVLSLEVGEHIPQEFEQVFLDNLCNHSNNLIILSWAVPGQDGLGHVNCKPNDYIQAEMLKRGFEYDSSIANHLRRMAHLFWFKDTLMAFRKCK